VDRLKTWTPTLLCAAAAVLVLFPLSVYPSLFHRSPNVPLHLMVLDHLTAYFQGNVSVLSHVTAADFPTGRPVRIIGWPFQLAAVPLVPIVGRVVALNVALLASLMVSGLLMVRLISRMGMGVSAQMVGGLAWVMNPLLVSFLSNGQYENHVGWAIPLALLGIMRSGIRGHLMLGLGLLGAAFSSPYQAVPAAVVVTAVLWMQRRPNFPLLAGTLGTVFGLCYLYYTGPQPAPGGECGPTSGTMPLVVAELFGFTGALQAELPMSVDRWTAIRSAFANPVVWARDLDLHNLVVAPGSGFVGWLPLFGGAIGLWRARSAPWARPLMVAATGCVLLALGPDLEFFRARPLDIPMPADLLGFLPGISEMGTTLRFMSGAAFVGVVGVAFLVESMRPRPWVVALLLAAVGVDWAFGTVSPVPMGARAYQLPRGFDALPETGAVITVPVREGLSPEAHLWMGAVLERPVVGYCDASIIDYREQYGIIDYAQGGAPPARATINQDFAALHAAGIHYIAFMVVQPGAAQFEHAANQLQYLLGTADAVGDGIIGYRTERSVAQD
jgi:hypothetical protein